MPSNAKRPSIRLLIPYFGRWPFWMPYFIASCRSNPDIDWLLFTDCAPIPDCPPNVVLRRMSYADYCALVGARLRINFAPENPYKLCDIKPALGAIHLDDLAGYDFWGFSDIDLVYGQLREHFSAERLARYSLVSTHARRVSGHLCLIRNSEKWNNAFRLIADWPQKYSDPRHQALDESDFSRPFIRYKNWPAPLRRISDHLNRWRRASDFSETFSTPCGRVPWTDGSLNFPQRWDWRNGVITSDRDGARRFPYLHFIGLKRGWEAPPGEAITDWQVGEHFWIDRAGIHQPAPAEGAEGAEGLEGAAR